MILLARDVLSALDLRELCIKICRELPALLEADTCSVALRHMNGKSFETFNANGCDENVGNDIAGAVVELIASRCDGCDEWHH